MARKYIFHRTHKKKGGNRHIECKEGATIVCAGDVGCVAEQGLDALDWEYECERQGGNYSEVVVGGVITSQTGTH
jgi:hypothetical protein